MGERVAVVGVDGPVGMRVRARLVADPEVVSIVELDPVTHDEDILCDELAGVDSLVVLGTGAAGTPQSDPDGTATGECGREVTGRVLRAAAKAGVGHLVVISSAMTYGAWPNGPVPLTENAPVRPVPESAFAMSKAELERAVDEWRHEVPAATVAVLRPVVVLSEDRSEWLVHSGWLRTRATIGGAETPRQFLHMDDLVDAIDLARREHLDGPFNVAPDGWLSPDLRSELEGPASKLQLPEIVTRLANRARRVRDRSGAHAGLEPYLLHPWVVANDRLKATGWAPAHSSEEAYIAAAPPARFASMDPRRRQEISLAVLAGAVVAVAAGVAVLLHRQGLIRFRGRSSAR